MTVSEVSKEMAKRGIRSPFDLTEMDQWVNDASRRDIRRMYIEQDGLVFGLETWTRKKVRGVQLLNLKNFEVDALFKLEDEEKVDELHRNYDSGQMNQRTPQDRSAASKLVNSLHKLALDVATWV